MSEAPPVKMIEFAEAFTYLEQAYSAVWDHIPSKRFCVNADDSQPWFLELEFENDEGLVWEMAFAEDDNQQVKVRGRFMTLVDPDGQEADIELLLPIHFT